MEKFGNDLVRKRNEQVVRRYQGLKALKFQGFLTVTYALEHSKEHIKTKRLSLDPIALEYIEETKIYGRIISELKTHFPKPQIAK